MAARTKTAAARAGAGGRGDEETGGGFRGPSCCVAITSAIAAGAVNLAVAFALIVLIGAS